MKCTHCGSPRLESRRETHLYKECGLDCVTLQDVEVRHCQDCGERELVIPRMEQLHALIARWVATKPGRLVPAEFRFLRKYFGMSSVDFASKMQMTPETLSRWENGKQPIPFTADMLIRYLVITTKPNNESYPFPELDKAATETKKPRSVKIKSAGTRWVSVPMAA